MLTQALRSGRSLAPKAPLRADEPTPIPLESPVAPLAEIALRGRSYWPSQTALRDGSRSLSFAGLHELVESFAQLLMRLGVNPRDRVAVLGKKDFDTVIAILAINSIGAAYVPLDAQLPPERVTLLLDDAQPVLVLGTAESYPLARGRIFFDMDGISRRILPDFHRKRALPQVRAEDVAYVMYTSGSTGRPKGVVIEHGQVHAFFRAYNAHARLRAGDCCMNTGAFHFDVSILDVFLPLYLGASVVLTPELPQRGLLLSTIAQQRVTHFYAAGTILGLMTGDGTPLDRYDLSSLQLLQTGAEVCDPKVVNHWLARCPTLRFINSYGPTEVTVGCVCFHREPGGLLPLTDVPIGILHENTTALVVSAQGHSTTTPFEEGELWLASVQLMRGYWDRAAEEAGSSVMIGMQRFYKTGDCVCWSDTGLLHYRGRKDSQVKIEGCRIDLSEVRQALRLHPSVLSAEVGTVRNAQGRLRVAAAVVLREPAHTDLVETLFSELRRTLPGIAVPIALLCCDEFPRTSSGKSDTKACMALLQREIHARPLRAFELTSGELHAIGP